MRINLNDSVATGAVGSVTRRAGLLLALGTLAWLPGCNFEGDGDGTPLLVATTGHIHDALVNLTEGVPVELRLLCGPGVDPHSYSATTGDVKDLQRAAGIVFNGFHLEAQLGEVLEKPAMAAKSWSMASAFPVESVLEWVEDGEVDENAPHDPHIWNHLQGWSVACEGLTAHVATLFPEHAGAIEANGAAYVEQIRAAHGWAEAELAQLPEARRVLVSGHDAFNYFAAAYGLETHAVLGIGNDPEADIRSMQEVAALCAERKVPTIFVESITDPKVTQALEEACGALGWPTEIAAEPLHSDDLGAEPPVDTYLGAFRTNVARIKAGLERTVQ